MSISPVSDDDVQGDGLLAAYHTLAETNMVAFRSSQQDLAQNAQWSMVVFAGKLALGQPLGVNFELAKTFAYDVIASAVNPPVGSQLHRKPRPAN